MTTVLVTGSCGYIGSSLSHTLLKRGYNVIGIDNLFYNQSHIPLLPFNLYDNSSAGDYLFVKADCNNWDEIKKYIYAADIVVPLHALVGAPLCAAKPKLAKKTNFKSIKQIVDKLGKLQRICSPNSNSGYGTSEKICTEKSPINCLSLYAKTKYEAEQYILNKHENSICFRLATAFGMSLRPRFDLLVNDLIYKAYYDKEITVFDPNASRNFVHVDDICLGFVWAIENGGNQEVYNLGNDKENRTKLELAELINSHIPFKIKIGEGADPDCRDYRISSGKLKKAGFQARTPIRTAIDQFKEFFNYLPEKKKIREKILKYNRNI